MPRVNHSILRSWLVWATLLAMMASVAACGEVGGSSPPVTTPSASDTAGPSPSAAPTASTTPAAPSSLDGIALKSYFLSPQLVPVNRLVEPAQAGVDPTVAVATAAMGQLLGGPTDDERATALRPGTIGSSIPSGTRLLGLDIGNGTVTVDLSDEFASGDILGAGNESWAYRLAQVTFTLTQFPTVEGVMFEVDGKPMKAIEGHEGTPIDRATRRAYADQLPAIFVDQPAWGGPITDPLIVSGTAQILAEPAQFEAAIVDATTDMIIVQQTVLAPCGTEGCWQPPGGGEFQFRLSIPAGAHGADLLLRVWEASAPDGSQINVLEYPLR